jgi:hypothetical protein
MKCFAKRSVLTLMAAVAFAVGAYADDLSFTLIPASGSVAGAPGQAVGWGFTLTDTGSDYVILDSSSLTINPVYGNYVDYIDNQFYVAGPDEGATINSPWNQSAQTGTGEFDLYPTDNINSLTGTITVLYDLYSGDPNPFSQYYDPDAVWLGAGTFSDPIQVDITPEPASWILLGLPFALLMLFTWRRQAAALRP